MRWYAAGAVALVALMFVLMLIGCAAPEPDGVRLGDLWCPPETRPVESAEYYNAECVREQSHD